MNVDIQKMDFTKCMWEERSAFAKLLVYQGARSLTLAVGEMNAGGPHKPHSHIYEQIILVVQGKANLTIEGVVHSLSAGCVIAIPPNAMHMFEPCGEKSVYYIDIFSPKRPDHTGTWVNYDGIECAVGPREERIQSQLADSKENAAKVPFFLK